MNATSRARRVVSGLLLLDKPPGLTSNGTLQTVKRLLNAAKAGYTGTLDPLATGLLPMCFGEATKFARFAVDAEKEYEASIKLGVVTSTADAEGEVLERNPVNLDSDTVERALGAFRGEIEQIPPMHSALKRDGQPLYRLARKGIEVDRPARRIAITSLEKLSFCGTQLDIRLVCSKGTYVRSLAVDIGALLGCGAHLAKLRRTRIGTLHVNRSIPLARLEGAEATERDQFLLPSDLLVTTLPAVSLTEADAARFTHGQAVSGRLSGGLWRVYGERGFLGVGQGQADGALAPQRVVAL